VATVLSADWVLPVEGPPIERGAVAIEDGRIVAVGTAVELGEGAHFPGAAILPGFVNAHTHLEYAVYAGFADGHAFAPWLATHIERKARIGVPEMESIARLGAAECLASGVTTVGDCSYSGAAATACDELGLRAIVYLEVFGPNAEQLGTRFEAHRERIEPAISDRVRLGISPHSTYTASLELWTAAAELGLPIATHYAESAVEREWFRTGQGPLASVQPQPLRALAERGLLDGRVLAAHCVHIDEEEIALLAAHGVGVAHCPRSNAFLGCGTAPLAELVDAGVKVGLGTDSPASAPSFDFFDELRTAVMAARSRAGDPAALSAADAIELGTLGSARALGLDTEVGSLRPGKRADVTVVSLAGSPYIPWEDPAAAVVLGGSRDRVLASFVDGQPRYERGEFEWPELRRNAARARSLMLASGDLAAAPRL
jgi:cytosine/adenosine deaminase-related metal-dependent hydrolase